MFKILKSSATAILGLSLGVCASPLMAQDDPEITLPEGFKATIFADDLGNVRHLAVREDGALYAIFRRKPVMEPGMVAMKDDDGDGKADRIEKFSNHSGSGVGFYQGYLYASTSSEVFRFFFEGNELVPTGGEEVIVSGFPSQNQHSQKPFTFDDAGNIYVNVGAPSNACQVQTRSPGSPGQDPCPQLERQAGIWKFDATVSGQTQEDDGTRFVTGIRNAMGLDWNHEVGALFFTSHGRDSLHDLWGDYYTISESAELPSEEFHRAVEGADYGWPYTYYDHIRGARMIAPEYGGDGSKKAEEGKYREPLVAFPGHWAPNDILFYSGDAFPEKYQNGAFITFHGSWNRAPLPQEGYRVVFVPFKNGKPVGNWETFANGFKGDNIIRSSGDAEYRPMGLAVGPDGALYISDSVKGRIWRVTYEGS